MVSIERRKKGVGGIERPKIKPFIEGKERGRYTPWVCLRSALVQELREQSRKKKKGRQVMPECSNHRNFVLLRPTRLNMGLPVYLADPKLMVPKALG
jgi:hypothetical protein